MIRANLPTFAVILVLIVGVVWIVVNWSYSGVLASKNAQIELLDRQIANLKQNPAQNPAYAPRRLTEGQRRDMTDRLKNGRSTVYVMSDLTCGDCGQYAADFERVLNDAEGWTVRHGGVMGPGNRPSSGLAVRVPDLNNPSVEAQRLLRALRANNIDFDLQRLEPGPGGGDMQMLIVAR
jgi:hypothetical protein